MLHYTPWFGIFLFAVVDAYCVHDLVSEEAKKDRITSLVAFIIATLGALSILPAVL